ncbi:MAG: PAS domain S-box protein [Candidatus Lokiarchaeota archaeon]|nr:PAS domain S-box protein [Candidatus Lokiarchaeota archaeon]
MLVDEKSLKDYENRYHFLIDNIMEIVGELDSNGIFTYVNPYVYDELGYQPEEIIGREFYEIVHPDDIKKLFKIFQRSSKSNDFMMEIRVKNKSNHDIWFEIKVKRIKDYNNQKKLLITLKTISRFKKLEEKLRENEEKYQNMIKILPEIQFWKILTPSKYKKALHTSFEMLEVIIENIPQYVFWKDSDLKYLGSNHNYAKFIGFDHPEDIIEKTDEDLLVNKEKIITINEQETRIMETRKPDYHIIESWILNNNEKIWLDMNRIPLFDTDDKVIGILVTFEEITERKIITQKLKESEKRYRDLANLLPQVICDTDERGNLIFVNNNAYRVFGYTQDDFNKGLNVLQMLIPEDRKRAMENIKRILSGKKEEKIGGTEYTALRKNGNTFPVLIYSNPIIQKGISVGFRSIIIDITEQKKAEQELKKSEENYRNLIEDSLEGVWVVDRDLQTTLVNSSLAEMMGYTVNEMIGKTVYSFMDDKSIEIVKKHFEPQKKDLSQIQDFEFRHKNGSSVYLRLKISPVLDKNQNLEGIFAFASNITERKEAEKKLKESEEKFRTITEQALMGIAILQDDKIKYINNYATNLLGYTSEEMKSWQPGEYTKIIHPEDKKLVLEQAKKKAEGAKGCNYSL